MECQARLCEACGYLYHPSGNTQQFCVRPGCILYRGDRLQDYLVTDEKQWTWRATRGKL